MTLQDHYDAFTSQLRGGILADKVHDVVRLTPTGEPVRANYVVVTLDLPVPNDARFTVPQLVDGKAVYRFDVRAVATTQGAVLLFAQTARERLLGHVLTVPDRVCDPVRLVDPVEEGRIRYDRTAQLFYADETFSVVSRRA